MFMKRRPLIAFATVILLVYSIAWLGKSHFPQYVNNAWVQYGAAIFTALGAPIGALFALKLMHEGDRWNGFGLLFVFCVPVVSVFTYDGIIGPTLGRVHGMTQPSRNEYGAIARISEFCITPEVDPAKRMERAAFAYQVWGIKLAVMHKNGSIALFVPHSEDDKGVNETVQGWKIADQTEANMDNLLRQMTWIFGIYLVGWCLVFVVGLAWFAFQGRRKVAA